MNTPSPSSRVAESKGPYRGGFTAPRALAETDPEMASIIAAEWTRQQHTIELIASENIVSTAVLEAQGSVLTNKYAEGYPGRRYYGGCEEVDKDKVLGMSLDHGGHLTHGYKLNFSGLDYAISSYGVTKDRQVIDYDEVERIA